MAEKTGVLLMAYGAVDSLDEIEPYLTDIRGGRPPDPALVADVKHRYELIGGKSPLLEITRRQAQALQNELGEGFRVYVGMRHWHPYIKDVVAQMARDGIRRFVALCLTPYYSRMSVGAYYKKLDEAVAACGIAMNVRRVERWNGHPLYVEALAGTVSGALKVCAPEAPILFSAHSLPQRILEENDPYPRALRETIEAVMRRVGERKWEFAYQSPGRTAEPWLGPDAKDVITQLHREGHRSVLMASIGFISDHMETLYDVDILYRKQAEALGMEFSRVSSLNASPALIKAMAAVILEHRQ